MENLINRKLGNNALIYASSPNFLDGRSSKLPFITALVFAGFLTPTSYANTLLGKKVSVQCGDYSVAIICGRDNTSQEDDPRKCNKNTLTFTASGGNAVVAPPPPFTKQFHDDKRQVMLPGTTPTAISCVPKNGKFFVSIEYSRDPSPVGMFFEWFENNGRRLTSAGKPLHPGFISPLEGLNWRQIPKSISIEGESQ